MDAFTHILNDDIVAKLHDDRYDTVFLDDGLYNHYKYKDLLPDNCALAIITSFVRPSDQLPREADNYFEQGLNKIYNPFMSWEEIKELSEKHEIVAHSHWHDITTSDEGIGGRPGKPWELRYLGLTPVLQKLYPKVTSRYAVNGLEVVDGKIRYRDKKERIAWIRQDTELMLEAFQKNLNIKPTTYVYPFNRMTERTREIIKTYGFTKICGPEREEVL